MKRKAARPLRNSTRNVQKPTLFNAESMFRQLERRIRALEGEVADLKSQEDEFGCLEKTDPNYEKRKRGRKPKVRGEDLVRWRNRLVETIEQYWPEIEPYCVPKLNSPLLRKTLLRLKKQTSGQQELCVEHLLLHFEELCTFVTTDRFRSDPRQIANALAGVPEIGFWTSLKRCQANPCKSFIGQRALKAYIGRKHSRLHAQLEERLDEVHFINVWRAYRTRDKAIQSLFASALLHAWKTESLNA